jgi:hypothetical protein
LLLFATVAIVRLEKLTHAAGGRVRHLGPLEEATLNIIRPHNDEDKKKEKKTDRVKNWWSKKKQVFVDMSFLVPPNADFRILKAPVMLCVFTATSS